MKYFLILREEQDTGEKKDFILGISPALYNQIYAKAERAIKAQSDKDSYDELLTTSTQN